MTGRGGAKSTEAVGGVVDSSCPGEDSSQQARGGAMPLRGGENTEGLVGDSDEWGAGVAEG